MALYNSLKAIFLHIDNHEKAFLSQYNLSLTRFYALLHIHTNPGINYIDLSELMLCTKSNTTRIVQSMQKDNLVIRRSDPADKRSYQLVLTEKGESLVKRIYPEFVNLIDQLMSRFNDDELEKYTKVSNHIESTLAPKTGTRLTTSLFALPDRVVSPAHVSHAEM